MLDVTHYPTMNQPLSPKQIGQRIAQLRKLRGFSQEELARHIQLSRPSLAQIELGNRNLNIGELQQISFVLRFSLDEFLSENFKVGQENVLQEEAAVYVTPERISVPQLQVHKLKNILLYLLEHCAGKPNIGENGLHILFYFCDFNHYEVYETQLTGATYRKLPYGPAIEHIDTIFDLMIEAGTLHKVKTEYRGHPQTRYLPLEKADLTTLKASETDVIDKVIQQMGDWPAERLSDYLQGDLPWEVTEEGEEIKYNLALYREFPYATRIYQMEEIED